MRPSAKSLILDLLSTVSGRSMPVRALVAAAELFAVPENALRVALVRLRQAGLVERDERGRYRLAAAAAAVQRRVAAWRSLAGELRAWDGGWVGVHRSRPGGRAPERGARALRFLALRELEPGLAVRPDNLGGGVARVREELGGLGLEPGSAVFRISELDPERERRARGLWDTPAIVAGYRAAREELSRSLARLPGLSETAAMVESFVVGGRVLRQLALDPLLPEPIAPSRERDALVEEMRRYDAAGRACWADFMRGFGVRRARMPAQLRTPDVAPWLGAA